MWVPVLKIHQWFLYKRFNFFDICFLGQYNYNNIHSCGQINKLQYNTDYPTFLGTGENMSDNPCCRITVPRIIRHFLSVHHRLSDIPQYLSFLPQIEGTIWLLMW